MEIISHSGSTALTKALDNNDWKIVTQLVDAGADTSYIDPDIYLITKTEKELLEGMFRKTNIKYYP